MKDFTPQRILRAGPPSLFDHAPFLSLCIVENGNNYIQMSKDEEYPVWFLFDGSEDNAIQFIDSILRQS